MSRVVEHSAVERNDTDVQRASAAKRVLDETLPQEEEVLDTQPCVGCAAVSSCDL